jgi:hypothetical protein
MTIRELLDKLVEEWNLGNMDCIDQALQEIRTIVLKCAPKDKNKEFAEKDLEKAQLPNVIRLLAKQVGYNQALADFKTNLNQAFGEGR